jgi:carbonic anhydrase/acetyltransferase-like protein (isoleucine patch superfamily)
MQQPLILSVRGFTPQIGEQCFIAPNATLVGDVVLGAECSVWFNAVVRGDVNAIRIGNKVNIQDNVVIHCTYEKSQTLIGDEVSIGHGAVIHGCTIKERAMVGMNAVIMDNAIISSQTIIAAGAVVLENTVTESGYIYAGIPAKKVKKADASTLDFLIQRTANNYIMYSSWFKDQSEL